MKSLFRLLGPSLYLIIGILSDIAIIPLALFFHSLFKLGIPYRPLYPNRTTSSLSASSVIPLPPRKTLVLIHGSGFNAWEYVIGVQYLHKYYSTAISSILTIDYDYVPYSSHGIECFATSCLLPVIQNEHKKYGTKDYIIIGHSLGGLIGAYYTELLSEKEGVNIEMVITIATPWRPPPVLDFVQKYTKYKHGPRYKEMAHTVPLIPNLIETIKKSMKNNKRKYHCVASLGDHLVRPGQFEMNDVSSNIIYKVAGHYSIIASPWLWKQIGHFIFHNAKDN